MSDSNQNDNQNNQGIPEAGSENHDAAGRMKNVVCIKPGALLFSVLKLFLLRYAAFCLACLLYSGNTHIAEIWLIPLFWAIPAAVSLYIPAKRICSSYRDGKVPSASKDSFLLLMLTPVIAGICYVLYYFHFRLGLNFLVVLLIFMAIRFISSKILAYLARREQEKLAESAGRIF